MSDTPTDIEVVEPAAETAETVEPETTAPVAVAAPQDGVQYMAMAGTQIDPKDGVRKPVDDIERDDAPEIPLTSTGREGLDVHIDNRATQIGPDGKRHPTDGSPDHAQARHD